MPRDPFLDLVLEIGRGLSLPEARVLCWWIRGVRDLESPLHFAAAHFETPPVPVATRAVEVCPRGWEAPTPPFLAALVARPRRCGTRGWGCAVTMARVR